MKQNKIVEAYKIIKNMNGEKFPLPIAYKLYKLRKELEPQVDFQYEQEKNLVDEFGGVVQENGSINFGNPENARKFVEKYNELGEMETDIEIEPVVINMRDVNIELSPNDIEKLDGFIAFE